LTDPVSTPPHLARPTIEHVSPEELPDFLRAVMRGFHGEYHDETPELDRRIFLPDRTFGHRVDGRWVSTCGAFVRQLTLPGGAAVDIAAVTIVTVSPSYRRRGLLREMMTHQLQQTHERGEPIALLWASESVIYGRFGYGLAVPKAEQSGQTRGLGFLPGVDLGDGSAAEVERAEFEAAAPLVHLTVLPERPGALDRADPWWEAGQLDPERDRDGYSARRFVLHFDAAGRTTGFATFRVKGTWGSAGPAGELAVEEVDATDPAAYARLWRFLLDLDLVRTLRRSTAPVDDPLRHLLADPRALESAVTDGTHLRLVDVARSLEARSYPTEVDLVLEVVDPLLPHNDGRFHLQAGPEGASVRKARRKPDLTLGVKELGTVFMGGVSMAVLAAAGRVVEHRTGAVERASAAFGWSRAPFTPDHF
jgi:predicted acetyltransferase